MEEENEYLAAIAKLKTLPNHEFIASNGVRLYIDEDGDARFEKEDCVWLNSAWVDEAFDELMK